VATVQGVLLRPDHDTKQRACRELSIVIYYFSQPTQTSQQEILSFLMSTSTHVPILYKLWDLAGAIRCIRSTMSPVLGLLLLFNLRKSEAHCTATPRSLPITSTSITACCGSCLTNPAATVSWTLYLSHSSTSDCQTPLMPLTSSPSFHLLPYQTGNPTSIPLKKMCPSTQHSQVSQFLAVSEHAMRTCTNSPQPHAELLISPNSTTKSYI
jgi:hypothetical protein